MKDKLKSLAIRTTLVYFISAGLYIILSDILLELITQDVETLNNLQTYKGLAFILVTSLFLFFDLRHQTRLLNIERWKTANAHKALQQSESNYRNMVNYSAFAKFVVAGGVLVYANPACAKLFGADTPEELLGMDPWRLFHPNFHETIMDRINKLEKIGQNVRPVEEKIIRLDGREVDVEVASSLFPYENQIAIHVILRDITDLITAREDNERKMLQLHALRDIDQLILNSFDLEFVIDICLAHSRQLLNFDAAKVYFCNETTGEPQNFQSIGFIGNPNHTNDNKRCQEIIQDGDNLFIPDISQTKSVSFDSEFVKKEKFISYCGLPLTSKGEIKGVFEIFNRSPIEKSEEFFDLLGTLSGQMAIAIDNIQLYKGLRQSLEDLSQAYDATIEGWSRAMDLRDEDTEGHTQRVTQNTILLARKIGISEEELIHVRRGVLLHDIGKLGIPDRILLKPGSLTDEEWKIMRQHPEFAYHMLQPVAYLRPALVIPYCHHEKWDGTGYPQGLKGEEIPLPARIFAIVDVWDALRSDRPYRPKWPEEKVLSYIHSLSGTHFDPRIVELFFETYDELIKDK